MNQHGSNLIVEDNGKVVQAPNDCAVHQSIRANTVLENEGIFEWDVIIEKYCWLGMCIKKI